MKKMNTCWLRVACRLAAMVICLPAIALAGAISAQRASENTTASAELAPVTQRLNELVAKMDWGEGEFAALIADADSPSVLFARQPNKAMQPGAIVQLFTAAAALDQLGPDFHFRTQLNYTGLVDKQIDTLHGSIVITSDGDPSLSSAYMSQSALIKILDGWADQVKGLGVEKVTGSVIGDGNAFNKDWFAPGWPMDRRGAADLPSISGLNFNHNVLDIFWNSGRKDGKPAQCRIFPPIGEYLYFANHVTLAKEPRQERVYKRVEHGNTISVGGDLKIKTEAHDKAAIEDPARFFAEALLGRLTENKIAVEGKAKSADEKVTQTTLIVQRESPPLTNLIDHMVHEDSALEAEALLKRMGMRRDGLPGSFESGVNAMNIYMEKTLLMPQPPHELFDGSGRSTLNRLTVANVIDLMRRASRQPTGGLFDAAMPRAGEGVMADRFEAKAPIWAKPASGDGVEAIAGWIQPAEGHRVMFALIVNNSKAPVKVLRRQLDNIVLDVAHMGEAGR